MYQYTNSGPPPQVETGRKLASITAAARTGYVQEG
jgi:hypothetical protein